MSTTTRIASFAAAVTLAAGIGAAALAGAGAANAINPDRAFLDDIAGVGISYTSDKDAVSDGKLVCQRLDQGADPNDVLADYRTASPDVSVKQAKGFILAAAGAYCPEHL
jgi:hypothetical protein